MSRKAGQNRALARKMNASNTLTNKATIRNVAGKFVKGISPNPGGFTKDLRKRYIQARNDIFDIADKYKMKEKLIAGEDKHALNLLDRVIAIMPKEVIQDVKQTIAVNEHDKEAYKDHGDKVVSIGKAV